MHLSALYVYPIKSTAALSLTEAEVERRGLRNDRRWMIVDEQGRFLTGRELARLTLIRAQPSPEGLRLSAPDAEELWLPIPVDTPTRSVTVWKSRVEARSVSALADAWLTRTLGRQVHLVYMDEGASRPITSSHASPGDEVSFADGFPLLLISQAALEGLNARLKKPVSMLRFRPNLVVDGCAGHAEDGWRRIRIGSIEFEVAKPCARCVFTTVDPERGERDVDGEPLRTLIGYRRGPGGVTFGQNLIARGTGRLRVGDPVEVLA